MVPTSEVKLISVKHLEEYLACIKRSLTIKCYNFYLEWGHYLNYYYLESDSHSISITIWSANFFFILAVVRNKVLKWPIKQWDLIVNFEM